MSNTMHLESIRATKPLIDTIESALKVSSRKPLVVLVGGCSRSGKSTLTQAVCRVFQNGSRRSAILTLDAFIVGLEDRPSHSTVMERFDIKAINHAVSGLLNGETVMLPGYDALSRKRVLEPRPFCIHQIDLLIIEGVVALGVPYLRDISDLSVYVDLADHKRILRLKTFYHDHKGLSENEAMNVVMERENEEVPFIKSTRSYAHIVFHSDEGLEAVCEPI